MVVKLLKLSPLATLPAKASQGSSGYDLTSIENVQIEPFTPTLIHTGLQVASMSNNCELQVRPRSGNALKKGYTVFNTPGTIDSDYRGEIGVIILAVKKIMIKEGEKIAQIVPVEVPHSIITENTCVEETSRGSKGFGSSG